MSWCVRPLNEETAVDFKDVVRSRFREGAVNLVDKVLRNPVRPTDSDAGAVGYENGQPACVRAAILRRLYLGKEEIFGTVGCMLAKKHGANRSLLMAVVQNSIAVRNGSKIFFTNTSVPACVRLNHAVGVEGEGLDTWLSDQVVVYKPFYHWWRMYASAHPRVPRLKFKPFVVPVFETTLKWFEGENRVARLSAIDTKVFASFWDMYLSKNHGLVASRTVDELNWLYEDRIAKGRVIVLGCFQGSNLKGYICVASTDVTARSWTVIDWIAIENDVVVLERLLSCACDFVKTNTPAIELTVKGFPQWVRPLIKRYAPVSVPRGHNPYLFHCYDKALQEKILQCENDCQNWFWGPYDGDACF